MKKQSEHPDPFDEERRETGIGHMNDQEDPVTMVLRHKDVRKCAHMWQSFQSGAVPGRIVIPSEVAIRDIRQIPFELDPPDHTDFRSLLEPWFRRPNSTEYKEKLELLVRDSLQEALEMQDLEVVTDFALPLQSKALTFLLNVAMEEADTWISWGTHVFRSDDDPLDSDKASVLYDYLDRQIVLASEEAGEDIYSVLLSSQVQGRGYAGT